MLSVDPRQRARAGQPPAAEAHAHPPRMVARRRRGRSVRRVAGPRPRPARRARRHRPAAARGRGACGCGTTRSDLRARPPAEGAPAGRRRRPRRRRRRVDRARSTPTLSVTDAFDRRPPLGPVPARAARAGEDARAAYRFPTDRRGRFEIGPLRATVDRPVRPRRAAPGACSAPRRSSSSRASTTSCRRPRSAASTSTATMPRAHGADRAERRVPDTCATTRPATTCATCTGDRPRAAGI